MILETALPMPLNTAVPEAPPPPPAGPKHRACDECRSRKLACTKEPDGCSRCKREGITCHYSPQKPMGRPRKRPRDDNHESSPTAAVAAAADEPAAKNVMADISPDVADPGMSLINVLLGEENLFDMASSLDFMGLSSSTQMPGFGDIPTDLPKDSQVPFQPQWAANFDDIDFSLSDQGQLFSDSGLHPGLYPPSSEPPPPIEHVPGLSPHASNSSNTASTPHSPAVSSICPTSQTQKCACSASLYLALSSIQTLEQDVTGAVRQARLAAKTAYGVVNCLLCSARVDTIPHMTPGNAMQSFQNMMLLATLIPTLVHAYSEILKMVDAEAQNARNERRQLVFMLDGLGGVWGGVGGENNRGESGVGAGGCAAPQSYLYREMDPTLWRLTVRALLKLDVYGLSNNLLDPPQNTTSELFHLGLRDIVNIMDARSKARHAYMESMITNGGPLPECLHTMQLHKSGEIPTCQRIIQIARQSIENLVIA